MSGGSHDYTYARVRDYYCDRMHDIEMNELVADLVDVFQGLEWYDSGDIDADDYHKILHNFKQKWFKADREDRLKEIIVKRWEEVKEDLLRCIG